MKFGSSLQSSRLRTRSNSATRHDYKCEWDVPQFHDFRQPSAGPFDLYTSKEYHCMLPNFGFFSKIKQVSLKPADDITDQLMNLMKPSCESCLSSIGAPPSISTNHSLQHNSVRHLGYFDPHFEWF